MLPIPTRPVDWMNVNSSLPARTPELLWYCIWLIVPAAPATPAAVTADHCHPPFPSATGTSWVFPVASPESYISVALIAKLVNLRVDSWYVRSLSDKRLTELLSVTSSEPKMIGNVSEVLAAETMVDVALPTIFLAYRVLT